MKYRLITILLLFVLGCNDKKENITNYPSLPKDGIAGLFDSQYKPFYHGVASGDPLQDRVIIWTRVTPEDSIPSIDVSWEIAEEADFTEIVSSGIATTSPARDYTVKVDVMGLKENNQYYYRFKALGATSVTGSTMTAPSSEVDSLQFAVVSCSNYEFGYFNAYGRIAARKNLNAVLHLGDYIYEYGPGVYGDTVVERTHIPAHEIISLQDYRLRYSQYRLDQDLKAVHQAHPFITIWDDHEIANNSYKDGAQNHQEGEGDYITRKEAARQVYYEWMPVRENETLYRDFSYGNLADLVMLDERLAGRTAPAENLEDSTLQSEERTMLGQKQLEWFKEKLSTSDAKWKIIGNQVIFSYLNWGRKNFSINLDSWDGYPVEQKKIADFIQSNNLDNVVFVTGDTHTGWAFETTIDPFNSYNAKTAEGALAVEFGVTSINSGNSDERFPTDSVKAHEKRIVDSPINPHLKYANMRDHGYLLLTLYTEKARADWYIIETSRERNSNEKLDKSASVNSGEVKLNLK
ncbi:MAG: alkaline phosphatase D family protein [Bacteroidota bacterium]